MIEDFIDKVENNIKLILEQYKNILTYSTDRNKDYYSGKICAYCDVLLMISSNNKTEPENYKNFLYKRFDWEKV